MARDDDGEAAAGASSAPVTHLKVSCNFLESHRSPALEPAISHARKQLFREPIQADLGRPVPLQKIFRLTRRANHF